MQEAIQRKSTARTFVGDLDAGRHTQVAKSYKANGPEVVLIRKASEATE